MKAPREPVRDLLVELFDNEHLRRFLKYRLSTQPLVSQLPSSAVPKVVFVEAALDLLERYGALDSQFFSDLAAEFPRRRDEIDAVECSWTVPRDPQPAPTSSERRARRLPVPLALFGAFAVTVAGIAWFVHTRSAPAQDTMTSSQVAVTFRDPAPALAGLGSPSAAQAGSAAMAAYRATIDAYSRGDLEGYYRGFSEPMTCFYNKKHVSIRDERRGTHQDIVIDELTVKSVRGADDSRVVLCDRGSYDNLEGRGSQRHNKTIVMVNEGGAWRIAVETTGRADACFKPEC